MGGEDFEKLALVHSALGFQFFAVTMSQEPGWFGDDDNTTDNAIQAMVIIGFILYTVVFILECLLNFGDLKGNKNAVIATLILEFAAVAALIIGIAIYGAERNSNSIEPYSFTGYTLSGALGVIGAVFLILQICG